MSPTLIHIDSPVGQLAAEFSHQGFISLKFSEMNEPSEMVYDGPVIKTVRSALSAYFAGDRSAFSVCFDLAGTAFQKMVWQQVLKIPFGETRTYAQIAAAIGKPSAIRAVASANAQNPLMIIVPCHRVIGSDGKLTGYAGGLERKAWLLRHEQVHSGRSEPTLFDLPHSVIG
jgi:methylated-DNA-[protein]-cysteine S-methyltransferase